MNDQIFPILHSQKSQYYQLAIILVKNDEQVENAIRNLERKISISTINLNLELTKRLLENQIKKYALLVQKIINEIVQDENQEFLVVKNIEILFHPSLQQNPLQLFKQLSRQRPLIVFWKGSLIDKRLIYATLDHPEYFDEDVDGISVFEVIDGDIKVLSGGY